MLFVPDDHLAITDKTGTYTAGELTKTPAQMDFMKAKTLALQFEGVQAGLGFIDKTYPTPKREGSSAETGRGGFHFFPNFEACVTTYTEHPEKVRDFAEKDVRLTGGDAAGIEVSYDVTGDFIDIDRFMSGEPEHFGNMENGVPRGKRLTIVITNSWSGNTDKSIINTRSKRVLRLIDWLESQGIRVRVIAVWSGECEHVEINLKHYDEALNLNDIAVVSHSDFLRRIIFRVDEWSKTWREGYGSSVSFDRFLGSAQFTNMPTELQDEHLLLVGVQGDRPSAAFDSIESELEAILSEPENTTPKLLKAML